MPLSIVSSVPRSLSSRLMVCARLSLSLALLGAASWCLRITATRRRWRRCCSSASSRRRWRVRPGRARPRAPVDQSGQRVVQRAISARPSMSRARCSRSRSLILAARARRTASTSERHSTRSRRSQGMLAIVNSNDTAMWVSQAAPVDIAAGRQGFAGSPQHRCRSPTAVSSRCGGHRSQRRDQRLPHHVRLCWRACVRA